MAPINLEAPASPAELYLACGDDVEVVARRPLFTGDVLSVPDRGLVMLLQHPCSMRYGRSLAPQLLVAPVADWQGKVPSDWTTHTKRMFLPEVEPGVNKSVEFVEVYTVPSSAVTAAARVVVLSQRGVNLLLQRWVFHLSRVVVPTATLHESIAAEHEEADLIGEEVGDLVAAGHDALEAAGLVDDWLDTREGGRRRRELLRDPQARSGVRRRLREETRRHIANAPKG